MHGLWNNIKSSVGETLDNIILSPKKLRKKFAEKKQNSTFSEKSNSFDKEYPEASSKPMASMSEDKYEEARKEKSKGLQEEGLVFTSRVDENSDNLKTIENLAKPLPSLITVDGSESEKDIVIERMDTGTSQRSNGSATDQPSISSATCLSQSRLTNVHDPISNFQPVSCHNIGDGKQTEKSLARLTGSASADHRKGGDTVSATSLTPISILKSKPAPPRRTNTLGVIDIELINDVGENESVEIDIADFESAKEEDKYLNNTRRQSISDRINRRRTSELAAEIIRLSAEHRKKEFSDLLDEHEEIVQNIEIWKKTGVLPPSRCPKSRSNLETVDDEDDSDDIIDEEPHYFRQYNDNSASYHSQDNKENKTLPRSH